MVSKRIWWGLRTGFALVGGLIAFAAASAGVLQYFQSNPSADFGGTWELSLTIEETSYSPYRGMKVSYLLFLEQDGASVTGHGEKYAVNEEELPTSQHDPIDLRGRISGANLDLVFNVHGTQRQTVGKISLGLIRDSEAVGGFMWTAASSSGAARLVRYSQRARLRQMSVQPAVRGSVRDVAPAATERKKTMPQPFPQKRSSAQR